MTLSRDKVIPSVFYIEAWENWQKQSYRNRCRFLGAEGVQELLVPIRHDLTLGGEARDKGEKIPIRDVLIDYKTDWITIHKRAIFSAYRTSAFFEYYMDELWAILDSRPESLFGLNIRLLEFFLDKLGIAYELRLTEEFIPEYSPESVKDMRFSIHPKKPSTLPAHLQKEYFQVFSPRLGFTPALSIMDLLFNEGNNSITYLF